jgi:hypothetical protein
MASVGGDLAEDDRNDFGVIRISVRLAIRVGFVYAAKEIKTG